MNKMALAGLAGGALMKGLIGNRLFVRGSGQLQR
jgi:hypothetical protein